MSKYMAYVGSYSYRGNAKGITIYDVDMEQGSFTKKGEVAINNASYLVTSNDNRTLYSICDEGVVAYHIEKDGMLTRLNLANIRGMRGCQMSVDSEDKFLMVAGYHDGKATVLNLRPDGSIGTIVDGVYDKGLGSVAERTFRPHITCVRMTPDKKFIMIADSGVDQVKIYKINDVDHKLVLLDMIPCDLNSAPKRFIFSADGRFMYLMYEIEDVIDVFTYETGDRVPKLEKIQTIPTTDNTRLSQLTAACTIRFSPDEKHLLCSNAGDNTVAIFNRDEETGLLTLTSCLPISGEYPKDFGLFPDDKHLAVCNHESGSITFFTVDYQFSDTKSLLIMAGKPQHVSQPNCITFAEIPDQEA